MDLTTTQPNMSCFVYIYLFGLWWQNVLINWVSNKFVWIVPSTHKKTTTVFLFVRCSVCCYCVLRRNQFSLIATSIAVTTAY